MDGVVPARDALAVGACRLGGDPGEGARSAAAAVKGGPRLIPLTVPEVRQLLLKLVWDRLSEAERMLAWSAWRRQHQATARRCHGKKRLAKPP